MALKKLNETTISTTLQEIKFVANQQIRFAFLDPFNSIVIENHFVKIGRAHV